jgi:hypothetical protein
MVNRAVADAVPVERTEAGNAAWQPSWSSSSSCGLAAPAILPGLRLHGGASLGLSPCPARVLCLLVGLLILAVWFIGISAGLGDGNGSAGVCSEGARTWVVGEGGASGAQVVNQLSYPCGGGELHCACWRSCLVLAGEQDGQGRPGAARGGRTRSSRTYTFLGRPGSGWVALV